MYGGPEEGEEQVRDWQGAWDEQRGTVLGRRRARGPFSPWDFDSILWALRRQERA